MASHKEIVQLTGVLRGAGGEATCVISAVKTTLGTMSGFSNCDIVSTSHNLPDGIYVLSIPGEPDQRMHKEYGEWVSA